MLWAAVACALLNLGEYVAVTHVNPAFTLTSPRGGILPGIVWNAGACWAVHSAGNADHSASMRFQLGVGGWILLLVQVWNNAYVYAAST